jgi:hypothetical protein
MTITRVRHFFSIGLVVLSELDKVPRRCLLVSTTADQKRTSVTFSQLQTTCDRRGTDDLVMTTTSVAISSLLQQTAAPPSSGGTSQSCGIFSIGLVAVQSRCAGAKPPRLTKPATVEIDRGRGIGEAASQWAGAAFTGHGGDVGRWDGFVHKGQRKVAVMLHLKAAS